MIRTFPNPTLTDLLYVAHRAPEDERRQWQIMGGEEYDPDTAAATMFLTGGPKFVLVDDADVPVSVGGFAPKRPGVWRDWMVNTPEAFGKYGFGVTRACRKVLDKLIDHVPEFRRIECICPAERTRAMDWYRALGLESEGIQRGAGANGEDLALYARARAS